MKLSVEYTTTKAEETQIDQISSWKAENLKYSIGADVETIQALFQNRHLNQT